MITNHLTGESLPLDPEDLSICQSIFDKVCADLSVQKNSAAAKKIAVYVSELYRQGLRNPDQLHQLAKMALRQY